MLGNIRGWELIIILVVVLLIFGPSKLPSLARSIGRSISEFRGGLKQAQDEIMKSAEEDVKAKTSGDGSEPKKSGNGEVK